MKERRKTNRRIKEIRKESKPPDEFKRSPKIRRTKRDRRYYKLDIIDEE